MLAVSADPFDLAERLQAAERDVSVAALRLRTALSLSLDPSLRRDRLRQLRDDLAAAEAARDAAAEAVAADRAQRTEARDEADRRARAGVRAEALDALRAMLPLAEALLSHNARLDAARVRLGASSSLPVSVEPRPQSLRSWIDQARRVIAEDA